MKLQSGLGACSTGLEDGRGQSLTDIGRTADWVRFILDRPMAHPPRDLFYSNTGNAYLLSAIIQKLSGRTAGDYGTAKLSAPLGIAPQFWRRAARRSIQCCVPFELSLPHRARGLG
jgi:CubicO group peptidase (beta-lactamase class C family)